MAAQGINLAFRGRVTDWAAVHQEGVAFASITVTESNNWRDPEAVKQVVAAQRAGIHTGLRHYARPGAVADQARHFTRAAAELGALASRSLAPALDVGADGVDDRFIRGWLKAVRHETGTRRMIVYADVDAWQHRLHPDKWADDDVVLWLAWHNGIEGRPGWFHPRLGLHEFARGALPGAAEPIGQDAVVYPFTLADMLL